MEKLLELSSSLKEIFKNFGEKEETAAIKVLVAGLKEFLKKCKEDILEYEIKYGFSFDNFKKELDEGRFGNTDSYLLEKDAMLWEDLVQEKQFRLEALRKLERINL